jgi:hypothetical protein
VFRGSSLASRNLDGKEGVDGSSPSKGFAEFLQIIELACPYRERLSRAGTGGARAMFARCSHDGSASGLIEPLQLVQ